MSYNQKINIKHCILSKDEIKKIKYKKRHYPDPHAASIEALKIVQKQRGWISDEAILAISEILKISPSYLDSVATFYSRIFRQPVGRHVIYYCDSVVCFIMGYKDIKLAIENTLGIQPGETTCDKRFTMLPICCLGNCDKGPSIMIDEDTHSNLTPKSIPCLLEQYK